MKINNQTDIKASPETVWHWLGDPENAMQWQKSVAKTEIIHKTDNWVGTTFRERVEENGSGTDMEGVVIGYEEYRLLSMRLEGQYNTVDIVWRIDSTETGTRLSVDADIRFKSFLFIVSNLLRPVFKKKILAQQNEELAELKRLCETQ